MDHSHLQSKQILEHMPALIVDQTAEQIPTQQNQETYTRYQSIITVWAIDTKLFTTLTCTNWFCKSIKRNKWPELDLHKERNLTHQPKQWWMYFQSQDSAKQVAHSFTNKGKRIVSQISKVNMHQSWIIRTYSKTVLWWGFMDWDTMLEQDQVGWWLLYVEDSETTRTIYSDISTINHDLKNNWQFEMARLFRVHLWDSTNIITLTEVLQ